MQRRLSLLLVSFFILLTMPAFSGAASAASGLCCAKNTLKESTEKQCEKNKGKFYTVKEHVKAQKECRSQSSAAPGRAVIPTKSEIPAFCCVNGVVKKATQGQCSKMKGNYFRNSAQAKQNCKPKKVFCCVDGKTKEVSPAECKKRKGTPYTNGAEAKKKCKPAAVYCCVDGKTKKTSPQQCKQHKGTAYKSAAEAKRKCKPADVYACVDGVVRKMSLKQCKSRKVTAHKTRIDADKVCRAERSSRNKQLLQSVTAATQAQPGQVKVSGKNTRIGKLPDSSATAFGYCCTGDGVSRQNQKECEKQKGVFSKSRISAEKICRAQKSATLAGKEKSGPNSPLLPVLSAVTAMPAGQVKVTDINSRVGDIAIARPDDREVGDLADVVTIETCKVSGWVAINGQAPTVPVSLQLTATGDGQGRVPPPFRLSLDGTFSVDVLPGSYRLQPLFPIASDGQEQISISANEFVCQPDWAPAFPSTFNWPESSSGNTTPPPMCVLVGAVNYEAGTDVSEIQGVTVYSAANGMTKAADFNASSASYRVEIPPGSSYTVRADVHDVSRLSSGTTDFTLGAEQAEHRVNLTVEKSEFACVVGVTVLVDGQPPTEAMSLQLRPVGGNSWEQMGRSVALNSSGMHLLSVSAGNYLLEPLFAAGSVYTGSFEEKQFFCDETLTNQVKLEFSHISPPLCTVSGKVTNNGHWDSRITSLTLRSYGEDRATRESIPVPVTAAGFQIVIPSGVPYNLAPDVPEGMESETKFFDIAPEQRSHTVNFDLDNAEFNFGQLKVLGFNPNHSEQSQGFGDPGPVQFSIETLTRGGNGRSYTRSVRLSSRENPGLNVTQDCVFSADGSCNFSISLYSGFNRQTDSIRVVMVDHEGEANSGRTWGHPFRLVEGDLKLHNLMLTGTTGDRVISFSVKNVGVGMSNPCRITVRVNEEDSRVFSIRSLQAGTADRIEFKAKGRPTESAIFHSQIKNSCDPLTRNNQRSQELGFFWEETSVRGVLEWIF